METRKRKDPRKCERRSAQTVRQSVRSHRHRVTAPRNTIPIDQCCAVNPHFFFTLRPFGNPNRWLGFLLNLTLLAKRPTSNKHCKAGRKPRRKRARVCDCGATASAPSHTHATLSKFDVEESNCRTTPTCRSQPSFCFTSVISTYARGERAVLQRKGRVLAV